MDIRDQGDREDRMLASFEEDYGPLPKHKIVCPTCGGKGTHVNPSIDSHGLSSDDFYSDPDFEEAYFNGYYDVTCYRCNGRNVVDEVDYITLERTDPELYQEWESYINAAYDHWAEVAAEQRAMGYY